MKSTNLPAIEGGTPVRETMLPFCKATITDEEIQAVTDTLRSGWLTTGPRTKKFESKLAEFLDVPHVTAMNSCTSALYLALVLTDIGPGDEVITTPVTFPATANVIIHRNAIPVFADIDPETLNIDPEKVVEKISPKTKALIPVHMAGQPCRLDELAEICQSNGITMIQDSAHALEAEWKGKKLTAYSELSAYSFYATKNITCGEGGALAGHNSDMMERASMLSLFGISKDAWKRYNIPGYQHWETLEAGYKFNMFDIQAALGLVQLNKINDFQEKRKQLFHRYEAAFKNHPSLLPIKTHNDAKHAHYLFILKLNLDRLKCTRDMFMSALEAEYIGIGIHFRSLLDQHYYKHHFPDQVDSCPNAHLVSQQILSLPLYPTMTDRDQQDVIDAVIKLLKYYEK